jgi:hypothetical protein
MPQYGERFIDIAVKVDAAPDPCIQSFAFGTLGTSIAVSRQGTIV